MWENVLGHRQQKNFLQSYLQAEERPHGLLFVGPSGLGKELLAFEFARSLLCFNSVGKDNCESCHLLNFEEGIIGHPDFILVQIEEDYKSIRIEQIKELIVKSAFGPALSKNKVCIIEDVDKMSIPAANSFLKLLEEPPEGWVIILLAESEKRLLSTILSRVVTLRFHAVPEEEMLTLLHQAVAKREVQHKDDEEPLPKLTEEQLKVLSRISEGAPGEIESLLDAHVMDVREMAKGLLQDYPLATPENYILTRKWYAFEREQAILFLKLLQLLTRDMLMLKLRTGSAIYNCDSEPWLKSVAGNWSVKALKEALALMNEAYTALVGNVGVKLTLEAMALKINQVVKA